MFFYKEIDMTTKKCISCLKDFTDESPGMGGVFKYQRIGAGVCPECSKKLEVAQLQGKEMFEVSHGNPKVSTVRQGSNKTNGQVV